jgi:hypothetical protein
MTAQAETMRRHAAGRSADRLAAGFLLILLAVGSLALWIAIPIFILWALSKATESSTGYFVLAIFAVPAAMVLFALALMWLNGLYLRVSRVRRPDDDGYRGPPRGPLPSFLSAGMVIALAALFVWIFFVAENPPYTVW